MGEQYKKLARLAVIVGIVYLGFRYLLPLFLPFAIAYVIAVVLRKPVGFLWRRLRVKPVIGGTILLVLLLTIAGGSFVYIIKVLLRQFADFAGNYDAYVSEWDGYFGKACKYFDVFLR